jgi:hypothetical protein
MGGHTRLFETPSFARRWRERGTAQARGTTRCVRNQPALMRTVRASLTGTWIVVTRTGMSFPSAQATASLRLRIIRLPAVSPDLDFDRCVNWLFIGTPSFRMPRLDGESISLIFIPD